MCGLFEKSGSGGGGGEACGHLIFAGSEQVLNRPQGLEHSRVGRVLTAGLARGFGPGMDGLVPGAVCPAAMVRPA